VVVSDFKPPKEGILSGAASRSSYACNVRVHKFKRNDSDKVLLLEYHKTLADVVGPDARDVWEDEVAPRHMGALNVLFWDGHVETHLPSDIDPRVNEIHELRWRPDGDVMMYR
jgi:prepilin-type processing-associated H-X9-DG protein